MYYHVQITPVWDNKEETVASLKICCTTDAACKKGKAVAAYIKDLVTIPSCPMKHLQIRDSLGELPWEEQAGEAEMNFVHRNFYLAERDTEGEITLSYEVTPRVQPEEYRSSPYFDLVAEKGGVLGTGTTFLLHLPEFDTSFDYHVSWELSGLPEGARGVWSLGCGTVDRPGTTTYEILFTAYMTGLVHSAEKGNAGFYWFDELPFDGEAGAGTITSLFDRMAAMFHDKGGDYRVFTRRNHFQDGGGTALTRSYIYGYGTQDDVTEKGLQALLAHEMVHNWPTMKDTPPGLGTWYVEGSAEYYCTLVLMEMGLCSLEETAQMIQEKVGSFYENAFQESPNLTLGENYWKDRRCQRLPYSRGMLYLSNLDARIQRETKGEKSLLDIEVALLDLEDPTPEDFIRIGSEIAGFDLRPGYEFMAAGGRMEPDPDAFHGKFIPVPVTVQINDAQHRDDREVTGEERPGYRWDVRK
jgi:hypothetical protein